MKPRSNYFIAKKIAETCIVATPYEKHFALLQEMFGFDGILNFSQTMNELISMDQMDIFGISKEMQIILKHVAQLKALSHIALVRKSLQNIYEKVHNRTVVIVKIGQNNTENLAEVINEVSKQLNGMCDFVYQTYNSAGIIIQFNDKILEYTPSSIAKMLKSA